MPTTLLVVAHPRTDSLTAAVAARTRARLLAEGHTVDLLDLAAEGFDPRMTPEDEPDWADRDKKYSPEVHAHMDRIVAAVRLLHGVLRQAGVAAPRIGVAALNPHGGEGGMFGPEEATVIGPAVATARADSRDQTTRPGSSSLRTGDCSAISSELGPHTWTSWPRSRSSRASLSTTWFSPEGSALR